MTSITVVRHAEAEGNLYRRAHGQYDSLITENGHRQIETLRNRFADVFFDAVYSSDLFRARTTAQALSTVDGRAARAEPGLREIHLGVWEDRPWGEIMRSDEKRYQTFARDAAEFEAPEGESMRETARRMRQTVARLSLQHPNGRIAMVSHGMAIRTLFTQCLGLPLERMQELAHWDNASIGELVYDGGAPVEVRLMGDNTHLGAYSTLNRQNWWRNDPTKHDVNFYFRPADFSRDVSLYLKFRRDAWMTVYNTARGFEPTELLKSARRMASEHPRAVVFAMKGEEPVGLLELDTGQYLEDGVGHISLVYLRAEVRGQSLGAQLIGHAVSVYRALERRALHLRVAVQNLPARRFYDKMGFTPCGWEDGAQGRLLVLQKPIAVFPRYTVLW